ncbi:MAG TPA: EamA family transporter [Bacillota bacterium]|nr:EamA family transporter [Bacillota bacterium]
MHTNPKYRAIFYMVMCAFLWSTAGIFIKLLPWNPMAIAGIRSLIAAGVYVLFMRSQKIPFVINKYSLLAGFFLTGVFVLFVSANKLTTSANAIVLQYCAPIFILVLSALIFKQKFRKGDVLTVAATTLGISLFFFGDLSAGYMLGNLLAIAAGIFFASMFITTNRADEKSRSSGILMGHLFTALIGIPFAFFFPTPINSVTVATILAMGIFQLGIPYVLYNMAARHCSALACSLISAIEPLLNPLWVFFFNGEVPGFDALLGGALVITAVVAWTIWSSKSPAPEINEGKKNQTLAYNETEPRN